MLAASWRASSLTARKATVLGHCSGHRRRRRRPGRRAQSGESSRTLAYTLFALGDVSWEPGSAAERLGIAGELAPSRRRGRRDGTAARGPPVQARRASGTRRSAFAAQLDTFTRLAEDSAIPRYLYLARSREATLASLTGPFELADELIDPPPDYGERIGEPDTWAVQASQLAGLALLRHDWTRISALAAARGQPLTPPEIALHERAWLLIESGDLDGRRPWWQRCPDRGGLPVAATAMLPTEGARGRCRRPGAVRFPVRPDAAARWTVRRGRGGGVHHRACRDAARPPRRSARAVGRRYAASRGGRRTDDRLGARLHGGRARAELERVRAARCPTGEAAGGHVGGEPTSSAATARSGRSSSPADRRSCRTRKACGTWPSCSPPRPGSGRDRAGGRCSRRAATAIAAFGADPVLDDRARAAYRARLADLDEELAQADAHHDIERSARLAAEREALIDELARATGLGGRRRRLGDATERARTTVTARIRDAIGRIERAHPELGRHLRASIVTGAWCAYRPAETVRWSISQS